MRKGFTIIELLVASLLLGMLVTILTMIFNQSSIAWRTGAAGVSELDDIRDNIAELRDEADNAFVWHNRVFRNIGLWNSDGTLRSRSCDAPDGDTDTDELHALILRSKMSAAGVVTPNRFISINVGQSGKVKKTPQTYTVNVKSAGPDRVFNTYDDIWSWPDDFE